MAILHTQIDSLPPTAHGCVVVIGNFDGIHLGHRALIKKAREIAQREKSPLGLITFEPHPQQFFQPVAEPFRLTLLPMKQRLLVDLQVDHLFSLEFNKELSLLRAEDFIDRILVQRLKAWHIVVGADFEFGRGRSGTVEMLETAVAAGKFKLTVVEPVSSPGGEVYSSTAIRLLLRQGKFREADRLLGWPWQIEAPVVHGDKRGRTLGFPTANQNVPDYVRIPFGVYAVRAQIENETVWRDGVANFGIRPMFEIKQPISETFLFDFVQDIYGKMLRIQPILHLRPEMSFKNVADLGLQMKEDCIAAKAVLKSIQVL